MRVTSPAGARQRRRFLFVLVELVTQSKKTNKQTIEQINFPHKQEKTHRIPGWILEGTARNQGSEKTLTLPQWGHASSSAPLTPDFFSCQCSFAFWMVVPKAWYASESPGGLVKTKISAPTHRVSDAGSQGQGLRICVLAGILISNSTSLIPSLMSYLTSLCLRCCICKLGIRTSTSLGSCED